MDIEEITAFTEALGGVLTLKPGPGDGTPEIAWGDRFFYWAPDGVVPQTQPFATVVTKDYPGEPSSGLGRDGAFRVNIAAGAAEFAARIGRQPRDQPRDDEPGPDAVDVVLAHPVYGDLGWLAVVDPGPRTQDAVRDLLTRAHGLAQGRAERRG